MAIIAQTPGKQQRNLGANHRMWTDASLHDSGQLKAFTNTHTGTWFGGFTGGVKVAVLDANGIIIALTDRKTFGVDGTITGNNDRTDEWDYQFPAGDIVNANSLEAIQAWAPRWDRNLENAVKVGRAIAEILALM
ncbi:hypothetical protein [Streptomyces sp. NPDC096132]|uniref:hypothetical protein n=1 Tax=Streptomyces sp. NPDC096132 TaxID=3366075 RepID=UPI00382A7548